MPKKKCRNPTSLALAQGLFEEGRPSHLLDPPGASGRPTNKCCQWAAVGQVDAATREQCFVRGCIRRQRETVCVDQTVCLGHVADESAIDNLPHRLINGRPAYWHVIEHIDIVGMNTRSGGSVSTRLTASGRFIGRFQEASPTMCRDRCRDSRVSPSRCVRERPHGNPIASPSPESLRKIVQPKWVNTAFVGRTGTPHAVVKACHPRCRLDHRDRYSQEITERYSASTRASQTSCPKFSACTSRHVSRIFAPLRRTSVMPVLTDSLPACGS